VVEVVTVLDRPAAAVDDLDGGPVTDRPAGVDESPVAGHRVDRPASARQPGRGPDRQVDQGERSPAVGEREAQRGLGQFLGTRDGPVPGRGDQGG